VRSKTDWGVSLV